MQHGRINKIAREGLTVCEAAEVAGIGRTKMFEWIKAGIMPARKAGKKTIVLHGELLEVLNNLPRAGAQRGV
jgi:excisionase family DNA binding protein